MVPNLVATGMMTRVELASSGETGSETLYPSTDGLSSFLLGLADSELALEGPGLLAGLGPRNLASSIDGSICHWLPPTPCEEARTVEPVPVARNLSMSATCDDTDLGHKSTWDTGKAIAASLQAVLFGWLTVDLKLPDKKSTWEGPVRETWRVCPGPRVGLTELASKTLVPVMRSAGLRCGPVRPAPGLPRGVAAVAPLTLRLNVLILLSSSSSLAMIADLALEPVGGDCEPPRRDGP